MLITAIYIFYAICFVWHVYAKLITANLFISCNFTPSQFWQTQFFVLHVLRDVINYDEFTKFHAFLRQANFGGCIYCFLMLKICLIRRVFFFNLYTFYAM